MEPLRHAGNPDFGAVMFRRTSPQIRNEGGLWDESMKLYPLLGAEPRESTLEWRFPAGARVKFSHLQYEQDKLAWQGSQIPLLCFDELTHFSEGQFFYLLSRNRSACGVRPYVRATTNPDALSWVKPFLAPWLDRKHESPAASGELRWFVRDGGHVLWVPAGTEHAKSVTFVRASIFDNKIFLAKDPSYLANLKALSIVDRARLLDGDWDIVPGGNMFRREWFEIVGEAPAAMRRVRYWDLAASEVKEGKDPDWTAGVLMGVADDKIVFLEDVQRVRTTPGGVEKLVRQVAETDKARYGAVEIRMEQEPGSSGVSVIDHYQREVLFGFDFAGVRSTGAKEERAKPLSSYAEARNVKLVSGPWNHDWLNEATAFPTPDVHDDSIDAAAGAFNALAEAPTLVIY
jgi:predicted phage terminase large subunit-like protein